MLCAEGAQYFFFEDQHYLRAIYQIPHPSPYFEYVLQEQPDDQFDGIGTVYI